MDKTEEAKDLKDAVADEAIEAFVNSIAVRDRKIRLLQDRVMMLSGVVLGLAIAIWILSEPRIG